MSKQENNLIKHQEMDLGIINRNKNHLKYTKKQSYEMCIEAVTQDGLLLEDIRFEELNLTKEQLDNLYLIAVKEDGLALKFARE
ncbi:hypothetical protein [Clostridioides difficile]|uniref:hypothetical protein n=1 Tax=Clostridioides difficile TaxID=1496 RepID=UPI000BDAB522|nr:hypothetical protein [Clostridioides difficile]PBF93514.1 hypothetical protein BGV00_18910 [Clostridioides difficile]